MRKTDRPKLLRFLRDDPTIRTGCHGLAKLVISSPTYPALPAHDLPLTPYSRDAFWGGGERGYIDFPALEPTEAA